MKHTIMAHLVAFYPDRSASLEVARALSEGGCAYLEVQFPFSDPTADGPEIQRACQEALKAGFTVTEGFQLLGELRRHAPVPVFLMSYANLVFTRGVERFLKECRKAGVHGLIVPDLPLDYDEGLYALGRRLELEVIPVVSPTIREQRLARILAQETSFLYASMRRGITGAYTTLGEESLIFLRKIHSLAPGEPPKVLAGFGVSSRDQVAFLVSHVHAVVVGSAFVRLLASDPDPYRAVLEKMRELSGSA